MMFKFLFAVITILGQSQALEVKSLVQSTCHAVSTWEQVLSGIVAAKFSRAGHTEWVSLSRDCESEMEDTLASCLNGSAIVCNDIVLSLVGQIPPGVEVEPHAKSTAGDDVAHWQRRSDCVCESHLINGETTNTKWVSSWTSTPETAWTTLQIATTSCDFVPKNASMSQSSKTITGAPGREPSPSTAFPQGSETLNENVCLINHTTLFSRINSACVGQFSLKSREPVILLITLYMNVVYIVIFTFFVGYPYIFIDVYDICIASPTSSG
ncbi:hypothetical protein N7510_002687 [Penicillium lagena]|uniref:uncharacterized protein n=1 Tax=Penicillium lagena TaxID=94218 RepID=UPI00254190F9|nr:uncharacterized protein N7510_002687 [Penicillium lagena]KAJ5626378.1 hypothetical protein N7510_002687 [Penicillium lagena]